MPAIVRTPKPRLERDVVHEIRLVLGTEPGLILWRNPVARVETWDPESGRVVFLRAGLDIGSADLVGVYHGRFVALEVKKEKGGRVSDDQATWLASVRGCGGFACVVKGVDEARAALDRCRRGELE